MFGVNENRKCIICMMSGKGSNENSLVAIERCVCVCEVCSTNIALPLISANSLNHSIVANRKHMQVKYMNLRLQSWPIAKTWTNP